MAVVLTTLFGLSAAAAPKALAVTGSISGNVTGAPGHTGVGGVEACAWETRNEGEVIESNEHCVVTAPDGDYEIGDLSEGAYLVLFWPRIQGQNYIPSSYDQDGLWPTDPVTVGGGKTTGIDVELPEGGSIEGQVTDEAEGKPLAGVVVCTWRGFEEREKPRCDPTDADGRYAIAGLVTDNYTVKFSSEDSGLQYFGEFYDDEIFGNGLPPAQVPVAAGSITADIDAALKPAAEIRGFVTAAAGGAPLSGILVCTAPVNSFFETYPFADKVKCSRTSGSGSYSIKYLEAGQYKVLFSLELRDFIHYFPPLKPEEDGYPTRYWNEKDTLWEADVLTLDTPTVVTGIDARLGPLPPAQIASAPSPSSATRRAPKPRCKPGHYLRKTKGKRRCVGSSHRRHRHTKSHRKNAHR